ncbi:hypothetical protein [Streptomyces sp. NPDC001809]
MPAIPRVRHRASTYPPSGPVRPRREQLPRGPPAPPERGGGPTTEVDQLAFASGTTCTGPLAPKGSGTAAAPITLTRYGTGAPPVIDGGGAPDAVSLTNQDHWRISDLRVTNPAATLARRTGIRISATDGRAHRGFDIGHVLVDRVAGQTNKNSPTTEDYVTPAKRSA